MKKVCLNKLLIILVLVLICIFMSSCHSHKLKMVEAKEPSCEEQGNDEYYVCEDCNQIFSDGKGKNKIDNIPYREATGHNLIKFEEVPATCTENGNLEYYHCSKCNKNFKDNTGKEELLDVIIKAKGHNYGTLIDEIAPKCEEDGVKEHYHCDQCGKDFDKDYNEIDNLVIEKINHNYEKIIEKEATCVEDGLVKYVCKNDENHTYTEVIHHGHNFDDNGDCKACGYVGRPIVLNYQEYEDKLKNENIRDLSSNYFDSTVVIDKEIEGSEEILKIEESGTYLLKGTFNAGISIAKNLNVTLILNNVNIMVKDKIAIESGKDSNVTISLYPNSINYISNKSSGSKDAFNAIHLKGDALINGAGKLIVKNSTKSAIKVSGALTIVESFIDISSNNHGISSSIGIFENCNIEILYAKKDGIQIESSESVFSYTSGYLYMNGVKYISSTEGDGIQADTYAYLINNDFNIKTHGIFVENTDENKQKYDLVDDDFKYDKSGNSYIKRSSDQGLGLYGLTQSCKGIKVGAIKDENNVKLDGEYGIYLLNNKIIIHSTDDCIHTTLGNIYIENGIFDLSTSDDGITCDGINVIKDGVFVIKAYEGIEGRHVYLFDGDYNISTYDDAINASSDIDAITPTIIVKGGNYYIDVYGPGDAIDANGKILIENGYIEIYTAQQEALDSDVKTYIDGGNIVGLLAMQIDSRIYSEDQKQTIVMISKEYKYNENIFIYNPNNEIIGVYSPIRKISVLLLSLSEFAEYEYINVVQGDRAIKVDLNNIVVFKY